MADVWQGYTPQGYDENTFDNLQLDVGEFHAGLEWDWVTTNSDSSDLADFLENPVTRAKCFGGTDGGGSFNVELTFRDVMADNAKTPLGKVFESAAISLSSTAKEFKTETFKLAIPTAFEDDRGWTTASTTLLPEHNIPSVSWCGRLGDGRLVAIVIENATSTAGLNVTFNNNGEGAIALEFQANHKGGQRLPFRMRVFPLPTAGITGATTQSEGFGELNVPFAAANVNAVESAENADISAAIEPGEDAEKPKKERK